MEPIPEKYQVRSNRAVYDSTQVLQKYSSTLRTTIRKLNVEGKGKSKDPRAMLDNDSQLRLLSIASAETKDVHHSRKSAKLPHIKLNKVRVESL